MFVYLLNMSGRKYEPPEKHRTNVAHRVLDQIKIRIQDIDQQLLTPISSYERLHSELAGVRNAISNVKQKAASVTVRKEELFKLCNSLDHRLNEYRPTILSDPVEYDSCEFLHQRSELTLISFY